MFSWLMSSVSPWFLFIYYRKYTVWNITVGYFVSFINTKIHVYKLASLLIDLEYLIRQHS